ncbi:DUF3300 domain-containing protein [Tropicimonas sp. IMCC6043]|uniref:DUF3300 domain-containing protein n=1 Tax=Tropicimonas sp. IMCC6043 TaxID=2510645 RepID=UPI00101B9BAE|nr:DUF3300 domain-containing protein [Tropicimonas sp. IMCC6043]RYH09438.1 DUF3300 domain-containing protein [Tropicimonas sp. IMCC6043]
MSVFRSARLPAFPGLLLAAALSSVPASAQVGGATEQPVAVPEADAAGETPVSAPAGPDLLSAAELQTLVAPVALFPDTLLIQILVGATQPYQVMKANRLLLENEGAATDTLEPLIEAEGYDPSVAVLAEAFPDVLHRMADHIDWTETVGDAMLAQSDDVMDAVQVMRAQAIDSGALATNEQQVVTEDPATSTVVVQPADPEIVYVPQYDARTVYNPAYTAGNAVAAGLITWGTFALIDEIFDDDDDWNDYWGCRNCAGWGGGPIYRDPDIDIDVDGNVNISNRIDIDRDEIRNRIEAGDIRVGDETLRKRIQTGDISRDEIRAGISRGHIQVGDNDLRARLEESGKGGWTAEPGRRDAARSQLETRREGGAKPATRPAELPQIGGTDALRAKLSQQTGAADIARPGLGNAATAAVAGGAAGALASRAGNRPVGASRPTAGANRELDKVKARTESSLPVTRPSTKAKPAAKPNISRPAPQKLPQAQQVRKSVPSIAKQSSGSRTKAAAARGHKAGGGRVKARR